MNPLISRILINAISLYITAQIVPNFRFSNSSSTIQTVLIFLFAGLMLAVINTFIRPILKIFLFPFIILTLGLASFLVNLLVLKILDLTIPQLSITTFSALLLGSIVISIANMILGTLVKKSSK